MGAKVAASKSFNYASCHEAKEWLSNTLWPEIAAGVEVVDDYRYLGAHISSKGRGQNATWINRVGKAVSTAAKIQRLPVGPEERASVLRTKVVPRVLYGVEVVPTQDKHTAKLTTAFRRCDHSWRPEARCRLGLCKIRRRKRPGPKCTDFPEKSAHTQTSNGKEAIDQDQDRGNHGEVHC